MKNIKESKPASMIEHVCLKENSLVILEDMTDVPKGRPMLLLHSCCGPCSTSVIERLSGNYRITVFFYNPNITDQSEYDRRRQTQLDFIEHYNQRAVEENKVSFLEVPFDAGEFYQAAKGFELEPEGGRRCVECFKLRMEKTAEVAKLSGFELFATTLTVSPHKDYERITKIGLDLALKYGLSFLDMDFKKKAGYQRSIELSKEYGLYRQNYCGCSFSERE
ncbi:epoxyqueuosine reductase QueH [Clostridium aminobutyricum]|uniref:Epoxyqueuosine reductase QueH n=1 Tax=Clostridium aminobutyricum TaxID=33953 RepID=A0A939D5X7_CLOAM|nr:epoxyqueuosine reductase QueH [Clostridium aminobutyricum]MBN7772044.1 epoxyqueuosine reductase QueH [Clostridium aminobutyricum]